MLINLIDQFNIYLYGIPIVLLPEFHLDTNSTISTYFLTTVLTTSSMMLGMIGVIARKKRDPYSIHWMGLAIITLIVAIDEVIDLHERLKMIFLIYANADIQRYLTWITSVFAFVAAVLFIRFMLHLSSADRTALLLAAILFLGGAVGMDFINGRYFSLYGELTLMYGLLSIIESGLEMFGSVVLFYALLNYMSRHRINIIMETPS